MKTALLIDPRMTGCSGDMFLAALVDLLDGFSLLEEVQETIEKKLETSFKIKHKKINKNGIQSSYLKIAIEKDIEKKQVSDIQKMFNLVKESLSISEEAKKVADQTLLNLLVAESKVHGKDLSELHLHETASIDTILDILGSILILDRNDLLSVPILGLPVNVGEGIIKIAHGEVSVPPPAVTEILQKTKYLSFSDGIKGELLTPTGAILLGTLTTERITQTPPLKILKIGYGAGTKDIESRANILKILLVEIEEEENKRYLSILETHLDDVKGETLGGLLSDLLEKGALDVSYYPIIMKKNRPAWCLRVICEEDMSSELSSYIMKNVGTLGVRENRFARYELERKIVKKKFFIANEIYECSFKERYSEGKLIGVKPEFDDVKRIAESTGIAVIELEPQLINLYYLGDEACE